MSTRIKFYRAPFVFLGAALCLGILFGELASSAVEFSMYLAGIVLLLFFIGFKYRRITTLPVLLMLVFFLGNLMFTEARKDFGTLRVGELTRVAEVIEAETTAATWKKVVVRVESEKRAGKWQSRNEKVLLYSQFQLKKGDVMLLKNELNSIQNAGNPGEFDAKSYWRNKNIAMMGFLGESDYVLLDYREPNVINAFFSSIRNNLAASIDAFLPDTEASIAKALLLGDKGDLSKETRASFSSAGAMHVLAISGLHVGIIMYLLFFVLKRFSRWISRKSAVIISLCFIWIFVGVTGASPSVVRSALMFSVLLIGQQSGRVGSSMNTLFFSAFLLLLNDPLLLFDIGFQLSYCAMLGIFLFYERVQSLIRTNSKLLNTAWDGTSLGIAAQVFTIPLTLYYFHQFPNYFWLTNLGVMLIAGVILGLGLSFFLFKAIPGLNVVLATILTWSLFALLYFVGWIESLPASVAIGFNPEVTEIILFYVAVVVLAWRFRKKWISYASVLLILFLVSSWQWDRSNRLNDKEIVVFNSTKPIIAVKNGDKIYGCYIGDTKDKAMRCLESYRVTMSGDLQLLQLKNGTTKLGGGATVEIIKTNDLIRINSKGESWIVRTGYKDVNDVGVQVVDMPYMPPLKGHYNLKSGALRIPLK